MAFYTQQDLVHQSVETLKDLRQLIGLLTTLTTIGVRLAEQAAAEEQERRARAKGGRG